MKLKDYCKPLPRIAASALMTMLSGSGFAATPLHASAAASTETTRPPALRMLTGQDGPMSIQRSSASLAQDIARQFAPRLGIQNPQQQLVVTQNRSRTDQGQTIRYQQTYQGIPIIAAEMVANTTSTEQLVSFSGETASISLKNTQPLITAQQAQQSALATIAKWYQRDIAALQASHPELMIYDPALLGPGDGPQRLVWQLEVSPAGIADFRQYMLVDAHSGALALHFDQVDHALNRATYTTNNTTSLPGTLLCNEVDTNCNGDSDADFAHNYAADTYNFYLNHHARDSFDDKGAQIISSVHYPITATMNQPNAFWNGSQIVYTNGMSAGDDVVAHELTHAVTNSTSKLFYYYQSGAINESLSDVWGEFVDQTNNRGNDSAGVRWLIGEDLFIGTIRNMQNPPAYGNPDRMTSGLYWTDSQDNGGVHINSGINNKAAYLMVDGGSFNGQTVTGIGLNKTAAIYYEAQTAYLTSGSDYLDLYHALNQSCQNQIGSNGITAEDCTSVDKALLAVEMNQRPAANFSPRADLCPAGMVVSNTLFNDSIETGLGNWNITNLLGSTAWLQDFGFASSGTYMIFSPTPATAADSVLTLNNAIAIPNNSQYYLHFNHAYDFESNGGLYYDGGVIEYSTDGGSNWSDAGSLIDAGRTYTGALASGNPLVGRMAFSDVSHGYNSTRLNLASLSGNNFLFRFRHTADDGTNNLGWVIDDIRVYSCTANTAPQANAGNDQNVLANVTVSLDGTASLDGDGDTLSFEWIQQGGPSVAINNAGLANASFTAPPAGGNVNLLLRVTDPFGEFDTDSIIITVNGLPVANAGTDQTVDLSSNVTLNALSSSDPEGGALTYNWLQTAGNPVSLSSTSNPTASFTAPANAETLQFRLTVTDPAGQTANDTITINVRDPSPPPPSTANSGGGGGCSLNEKGRFDPLWLLLLMSLSLIHLGRRKPRV